MRILYRGYHPSDNWQENSLFFVLFPTDNEQLTTNNCTGEAFGELFLAMTDNLSSKCFAPTNN
jgi:hypothetical protein